MPRALILDIDSTITSPGCGEDGVCHAATRSGVLALLDEAKERGVTVGINTARTSPSLSGVHPEVRARLEEAVPPGMHCWRKKGAPVAESKVECLRVLSARAGAGRGETLLVDDREENVEAAIEDGFAAARVAGQGIGAEEVAAFVAFAEGKEG